MQYNDTTNKNGIIQVCEDYCNLGDAGITGDSLLLKRFTTYTNKAQRQIWTWLFDAYGGWQYDDDNQTDLPEATATLTADQKTYTIPSDALTVKFVEIKNEGGDWERLRPITGEMINDVSALEEFEDTSGKPLWYRLIGNVVELYPASNYTQAASLKFYFDRDIVEFSSTDTTQTPGFAKTFHEALPIGASIEYLSIHKPDAPVLQKLKAEWDIDPVNSYRARIAAFYSERFRQMFPPRILVKDEVRGYM